MSSAEPKKTPLFETHQKLGAKLVDFHGWMMPIQYEGIVKEHHAVRERVGLFDISHMGEIRVRGKDALSFLQKIMTNDLSKLQAGQCLYSPMCKSDGGIVDDTVTYKFAGDNYLVVVNASNIDQDANWFVNNKTGDVSIENESDATGLLAVQGPKSVDVFKAAFGKDLESIDYYHFIETELDGVPLVVSRTGYTGEKGVEIFCPADKVVPLWEKIMEKGKPFGIAPIGLGARDTLRLEMKFALYGNDITSETNPLEAGLRWTVSFEKGDFIGRDALLKAKDKGLKRRLVCFQLEEPGVARHGFEVWNDSHQIGEVTSGTVSPVLGKSIGLAYVETGYGKPGSAIKIAVRQKKLNAKVVQPPFVKNSTK